jgi:hypothetical protein
MDNQFVIVDLNYLEGLEEANLADSKIIGGYVSTTGYTYAGPNGTLAYAGADAYGAQTYTNTNARTSTQNSQSSTRSYAQATAIALANNNGIPEKSSYKGTSIYYSGR